MSISVIERDSGGAWIYIAIFQIGRSGAQLLGVSRR